MKYPQHTSVHKNIPKLLKRPQTPLILHIEINVSYATLKKDESKQVRIILQAPCSISGSGWPEPFPGAQGARWLSTWTGHLPSQHAPTPTPTQTHPFPSPVHLWGVGRNQRKPMQMGENGHIPHRPWPQPGIKIFSSHPHHNEMMFHEDLLTSCTHITQRQLTHQGGK